MTDAAATTMPDARPLRDGAALRGSRSSADCRAPLRSVHPTSESSMPNAIIDEVLDPERTPSISAILPAYNEDAAIERSVLDVTGILGRLTTDYEIIVVDDGSRDRTTAVLAW